MTTHKDYPCDICGSEDARPIEVTAQYLGGTPLHTCGNCGFVFVKSRRSAEDIAKDWSDDLFGDHYTARIPYMKSRHFFLSENLDIQVPLAGKKVCDIGAGEGQFLEIIRDAPYNADVFGIEPSKTNCQIMSRNAIPNFAGTIEDYIASEQFQNESFDVVTVMWTLENCEDPKRMLKAAYDLLKPGGHILLSTSSRILVPFKKPLHYYLGTSVALDTHCFRFSANAQHSILAKCGFQTIFENRFIDHDTLCSIARKEPEGREIPLKRDNADDVINFFERWHQDTQQFYKDA
ncbi:class I SAM-dependent methyltransferase [Kiloniella litopenaei]|uniref:class I SAM-dependent methyltransferase n=1 Tax=Kiloniella litopenaei TaxID=1549748 RepID=UPI003BA8847B